MGSCGNLELPCFQNTRNPFALGGSHQVGKYIIDIDFDRIVACLNVELEVTALRLLFEHL